MTVVVGVDGMPHSYAAIMLARREAACRATGLTAVMAYTSDTAFGTPAARPLAAPLSGDEQREIAESTLRQAIRAALGSDEGVTFQAVAGMPGRVLVQVARTVDADLLVLATRREYTPSRLLGAVSQHVLRNAPCPVLVVPESEKEP